MAALSDVVSFFGRNIRTVDGRIIRGIIEPPKMVLRQYDGLFVPRALMKTGPKETVPTDAVILDRDGVRYIVLQLSEDNFFDSPVKKSFILFQVTNDMVWTRPGAPTIEPISGLHREGTIQNLGTTPAVVEFTGAKHDSTNVLTATYKVLVNVDLQLDDSLDGKRVRDLTKNAGITYADIV